MAPLLVSMEDLGGVWNDVKELFEKQSLLSRLEVQNKLGARAGTRDARVEYVPSDHERIVAAQSMRDVFSCFGKPYAHVFLVPHVDLEEYRRVYRPRIKSMVDGRLPAHLCTTGDWLVLYVILPGTGAPDKGVRKVFEKLRDDFNSRKRDRVCLLDLNMGVESNMESEGSDVQEGLAVVYRHRRSASLSDAWFSFQTKLSGAVGHTLEERAAMADEEARRLSSTRNLQGWSFPRYFLVKEGLADTYASIGLHEDALREYLELGIVVGEGSSTWNLPQAESLGICQRMGLGRKGSIHSAILGALEIPIRKHLTKLFTESGGEGETEHVGKLDVTDFDMRRFVTANQLKLFFACMNYEEMIVRALDFINTVTQGCDENASNKEYMSLVMWAFYACIEVGHLCSSALKSRGQTPKSITYCDPSKLLLTLLDEYELFSSERPVISKQDVYDANTQESGIFAVLSKLPEETGFPRRRLLRSLGDVFLQARNFCLHLGQLVSPALVLDLEADFQRLLGLVAPASPAKVVAISQKPVKLKDVDDVVFKEALRSKEGFERLYLCLTQLASLAYRASNHARTACFLDVQAGLLLLHARRHSEAARLFLRATVLYRKEHWDGMLSKILPYLLQCQEELGDPSQVSILLELLSLPSMSSLSGVTSGKSYWLERLLEISQKPDFRFRKKTGIHTLSDDRLLKITLPKQLCVPHVSCGDVSILTVAIWSNFTEALIIHDVRLTLSSLQSEKEFKGAMDTLEDEQSQEKGLMKVEKAGQCIEGEQGSPLKIKRKEKTSPGVLLSVPPTKSMECKLANHGPEDEITVVPGHNEFVFDFIAMYEGDFGLSHLDFHMNLLKIRTPCTPVNDRDGDLRRMPNATKSQLTVGPEKKGAQLSLSSFGGNVLADVCQWLVFTVEPRHHVLNEAILHVRFDLDVHNLCVQPSKVLVLPTNMKSGQGATSEELADLTDLSTASVGPELQVCLPNWSSKKTSFVCICLSIPKLEGRHTLISKAELLYRDQLPRQVISEFICPISPAFEVAWSSSRIDPDRLAVQCVAKSNLGWPLKFKSIQFSLPPGADMDFNSCSCERTLPIKIGPCEEFMHFIILRFNSDVSETLSSLELTLVADIEWEQIKSIAPLELVDTNTKCCQAATDIEVLFADEQRYSLPFQDIVFLTNFQMDVCRPEFTITVEHECVVSVAQVVNFKWKIRFKESHEKLESTIRFKIEAKEDDWMLIGRTIGTTSGFDAAEVTVAAIAIRAGELRRPDLLLLDIPLEHLMFDHRLSPLVSVVPAVPSVCWASPTNALQNTCE